MSCFPSKFARLANIGSVAKAKQSLEKEKKKEKLRQKCYESQLKIDKTLYKLSESEFHHSYQINAKQMKA